ncbi:sigma-70 family RNA polymerase sigma factor [uncultured Cellulomonas sp.]|uniref:sigma-70 family RNA polymerase sigma factor n=1 Tax=uncultured Cellulomonas sp. TaxID=189682 RepID=UPI00260D3012|nr:sigma-70 family RNA polymerase sigma factor [uncultured Cellulomonas sp.]
MSHRSNDDVFATFVDERGSALVAYAYLLTGELMAAQDLTQEALLKVFVRSRSGSAPDAAEAYVRRTILRLYIDGYRRGRLWTSLRHLVTRDDAVEGHELAAADRMDLRAALATLAPQERAAIVLRFYEDLTVPETADRMNLAAGSVKRYLSNAVRKLEAQLGPIPDLHPSARTEAFLVQPATHAAKD